jgi:hypothetical protein
MANRSVTFKVEIRDFDAPAWDRLQEARKLVEKTEKEIAEAFQKSDRFKAVRDLTGFNDYGNKLSHHCRVEGARIVASTAVELDEVAKASAYVPPLNLGEKTLNALLTGKLLDDAQKKALLKRIGVDLDQLTTAALAPETDPEPSDDDLPF